MSGAGSFITQVSGTDGADEVSYNPGNRTYDFPTTTAKGGSACGTSPACEVIINAANHALITTVPIFNGGEHSVASDPDDGNVAFLPSKDTAGMHDQGVVVVAETP